MISLVTVGSWLGSKLLDKGFDEAYSAITSNDIINKKFKDAVDNTSATLQEKYPDLLGGSIEYFFKSEKIFSELFKLLFRASKLNLKIIKAQFDTTSFPAGFLKEFILCLKKELLKDRVFDEILSNNQIYILFQGIDKNIKSIAENTLISSKDIKDIKEIVSKKLSDNFDFAGFKNIYKENVLNSLSQINFLGLGIDSHKKINRKNLQDIFVEPLFQPINKLNYKTKKSKRYDEDEDNLEVLEYNELLDFHDRIVILGNPGAGKSLLIRSLICSILSNNKQAFISPKICEYLPFRIELRKYIVFKNETKGSILKYIISVLETDYQIGGISESILNDILLHYKCIVFFDGLDEIFNIQDKIITKTDIENFQNKYKTLKSVTTSRIIGYEENSFNDSFQEVIIKKFNDDQINDYVGNWYEKEEDNVEIRKREIGGFLDRKHEIDKELITNPLLLSLIVIIYRNALKIPESKLEIYQSCTKTLVDKWEAIKNLKFDLDPDIFKNKDKLFADLAYWQYEKVSSDSPEVTYEMARLRIAESLIRLEISDDLDAETYAEKFMDYASKRSIYYEDSFTHKTFLEYYTAYWIYSNVEKVHNIKERNKIISKYINNPFWSIVLELLFNLIDKDLGTNSVIDKIIEEQLKKNIEAIPFLLSVCLKLKNISKSKVSEIIKSAVLFILNKYAVKGNVENKILFALEDFYFNGDAGKKIIDSHFKNLESEFTNNPRNIVKLYTLYLELHLTYRAINNDRFSLDNSALFEQTVRQNDYLFIINIYALKPYDSFLDCSLEFIQIFNPQNVFKDYTAKYQGFTLSPFFSAILHRLFNKDATYITDYFRKCNEAGLSLDDIIHFLAQKPRIYHLDRNVISLILTTIDHLTDLKIIKILMLGLAQNDHLRRRLKINFKGHKFSEVYENILFKEGVSFREKQHIILDLKLN